MNFVIVGPGAIGCLFAGILAEAGEGVRILDKDPERAGRLSASGIRLDDEAGTRRVFVEVTADPRGVPPPEFLLICVKAYDTAAAVRHALPLAGPETVLVSVQNGIGNAEILAASAGLRVVLCVRTSQGATHMEAGHVRHAGRGPTLVAPFSGPGRQERCGRLVEGFQAAGIESGRVDDAASLMWSKLVVNAAINPVTALHDVPNGAILDRAELRRDAFAAAAEAVAVAGRMGVRLLFDDAEREVVRVCEATRDNVSSMLQDVRRGRRTEIDAINGAVVKGGRALGVPVPVNARLVTEVVNVEGGK